MRVENIVGIDQLTEILADMSAFQCSPMLGDEDDRARRQMRELDARVWQR
jgi:hypothetical protein